MTTLQISLNDGTNISVTTDSYNAGELSNKLNDQRLLMVTIGDVIINKNAVKMIAPVQ